MSSQLVEPKYGLQNNCEPCTKTSMIFMSGAHSKLIPAERAAVVSPLASVSPFQTRLDQTLHHINAVNLGFARHPSAITGYTAGRALY